MGYTWNEHGCCTDPDAYAVIKDNGYRYGFVDVAESGGRWYAGHFLSLGHWSSCYPVIRIQGRGKETRAEAVQTARREAIYLLRTHGYTGGFCPLPEFTKN